MRCICNFNVLPLKTHQLNLNNMYYEFLLLLYICVYQLSLSHNETSIDGADHLLASSVHPPSIFSHSCLPPSRPFSCPTPPLLFLSSSSSFSFSSTAFSSPSSFSSTSSSSFSSSSLFSTSNSYSSSS